MANSNPSAESKYRVLVGRAESDIRRLAHLLSRMDPLKSPTRYSQLLNELNRAKSELTKQKADVDRFGKEETSDE